ncbi:hypothetical protein GCM10029963_75780 [Micromonospora andamanensis]
MSVCPKPRRSGATIRRWPGNRRTNGSQNSADEQLPWISSTGTPSGGPATRTDWVSPLAATACCRVSTCAILPGRPSSRHGIRRHGPNLPACASPDNGNQAQLRSRADAHRAESASALTEEQGAAQTTGARHGPQDTVRVPKAQSGKPRRPVSPDRREGT